MHLFHNRRTKSNHNIVKQRSESVVSLHTAAAWFPRSVASFSAANTALEVETPTFCLRCTYSADTAPWGGIWQWQRRPGTAAAQNLQTPRKLLPTMAVLIKKTSDTHINHLHIHHLIHI